VLECFFLAAAARPKELLFDGRILAAEFVLPGRCRHRN
jgi:hypothetical protein